MGRLEGWAQVLKRDSVALYLAARNPRTHWHAKRLAGLLVAYVLSPIDLAPDFLPLPGYLDDMLLVPAGIALTLRLVPPAVLADARASAVRTLERPRFAAAAVVIVGTWTGLAALRGWWAWKIFA